MDEGHAHSAHVHADASESAGQFFEILFGRPLPMGVDPLDKCVLPSAQLCKNGVLSYCKNLHPVLSQINSHVKVAPSRQWASVKHTTR